MPSSHHYYGNKVAIGVTQVATKSGTEALAQVGPKHRGLINATQYMDADRS